MKFPDHYSPSMNCSIVESMKKHEKMESVLFRTKNLQYKNTFKILKNNNPLIARQPSRDTATDDCTQFCLLWLRLR